MDVERAEEFTRQAYKAVEYLWHRNLTVEEGGPPRDEPDADWEEFNDAYSGTLYVVEESLGCTAATDEFTRGPTHPLTQGLARARHFLAEITNPPESLRPKVEECGRLVDAALAELDLKTNDPLVDAAAAMPWADSSDLQDL